jgi:hypothetical protein
MSETDCDCDDGEPATDDGMESVGVDRLEDLMSERDTDHWDNIRHPHEIGEQPPGADSTSWQMFKDIADHGEVHATVEGHDSEIELRIGTTRFDYNTGLLTVRTNTEQQQVALDRVISWYKPRSFSHD